MLPENLQHSSRRGGTTLAWSHLCAPWGLASQCLSKSRSCQMAWRWQGGWGLPFHACCYTNVRGYLPYFYSREFLTQEAVPVGDLPNSLSIAQCFTCYFQAPESPEATKCLQQSWMQQGILMCNNLSVVERSPEVLCFPGADHTMPGSCTWQCWPHWNQPGLWAEGPGLILQVCLQVVPTQDLSSLQLNRKNLDKAKEINHCYCRNWCLYLICLPAHFV